MELSSIQILTIDGKEVQTLTINGDVVWTKPEQEVTP